MLCPVLPAGQNQLTVPPTGMVKSAGSNRLPSLSTRIVFGASGSGVAIAVKPTVGPLSPSSRATANCWAKSWRGVQVVAAMPSGPVRTVAGFTDPSVVNQMTVTPSTGASSLVTTTRRLSGNLTPATPTCPSPLLLAGLAISSVAGSGASRSEAPHARSSPSPAPSPASLFKRLRVMRQETIRTPRHGRAAGPFAIAYR